MAPEVWAAFGDVQTKSGFKTEPIDVNWSTGEVHYLKVCPTCGIPLKDGWHPFDCPVCGGQSASPNPRVFENIICDTCSAVFADGCKATKVGEYKEILRRNDKR